MVCLFNYAKQMWITVITQKNQQQKNRFVSFSILQHLKKLHLSGYEQVKGKGKKRKKYPHKIFQEC